MPVQSGWANNCGNELFTVGWVQCPPFTGDCLPIIGEGWIAGCPTQHYTLGWVCCDADYQPPFPPGGGGKGKGRGEEEHPRRQEFPGTNVKQALLEDEEILLLVQAYFSTRPKR